MKNEKELYYLLVKRGKRVRLIGAYSNKRYEAGSTIEREDIRKLNIKPIPTLTWKIIRVYERHEVSFICALRDLGIFEQFARLLEVR